MRVLLVLASPYPAPRGSQILVEHLERGLRARGHAVELVSYGAWLRDRTGLQPARALLDALTLGRALAAVRRMRPDVVHAHNYEGGVIGIVAARLMGVPLIFHGHSLMEEELPSYVRAAPLRGLLRRVGRWLDSTIPRRADHVIAVTPALAAALADRGARAVTALRPVADPAEVPPASAMPGEAPEPIVCYAGNLDGYQNLAFLMRAFRLVREAVPQATLSIVTHARIDHGAGLHGAGVAHVRAEAIADVWQALGRAWVAVVPRVDPSGHPMKALNYMAAGKAIVTTASGAQGLRHGVDALVAPDGDEKAFASAIVELLRDAEWRARLGAAAREAVAGGDAWEAALDALEAVYRSVRTGARRGESIDDRATTGGDHDGGRGRHRSRDRGEVPDRSRRLDVVHSLRRR